MSTRPDIESIVKAVPGVIYRVDLTASPEGKVIFVSNKIKELTGYRSHDFLCGAIKWLDLVVKEDIPIAHGIMRNITQGETFGIEYRIQDKAGNIRWVLNQGYITVDNKKPLWRDGVILDITAFKVHEQELLSSKNALNNLVESLDDIVFEIDANGLIVNYYTTNRRFLLLKPASFLNKTIAEAFSDQPIYAELLGNAYRQAITQKERVEVEFSTTNESRVQWFCVRFTPLNEPGAVSVIATNITKQKKTEHDLEANNQFLRRISEISKIGGWQLDIKTKQINWSDEIYKIRETAKIEKLPLHEAFALYPPEVKPVIEKAVEDGIEKGIPWDLELPIITAKGNKKWIRDIGIPEMNNGKCVRLQGTTQDITYERNVMLVIQNHELQLELALKGGNLGTWNWNIVTGKVAFDDRWTSLLGYSLEETEPHFSTWEKLIHPEDKPYVNKVLQDHLSGKTEYYESEHRLKHKEGHWVWVLYRGKVIERSTDGKPKMASGTYLDISERKKIEQHYFNLQTELEEFKSAVSASSIVSITDLKGVIKYVNQNFLDTSRYNRNELIGRNHSIINSGHHPRSFWKEMWQTIGHGKIWRAEVKNKRKDGTYYWVDTFIIPFKNSKKQTIEYLSIRNDITEKKESEIKLQAALASATESDRLKSAFLANFSHEIRTPMNAIMGFAELLNRPNVPENKRSEFSQLIYTRSHDLLCIVTDILDLSRIEAEQISCLPVVGNLEELLNHLLMHFKAETFHLKNKNILISIKNELRPSESIVLADFIKLQQVIMNLLTNSSKFTQQGFIELSCKLLNPKELLFTIRDSGIGIPADQLESIFKPFHQATDSIHLQYGGSGLGLSICKGLVELCGGRIWVESELGIGSVFYFTMPYVQATNNTTIDIVQQTSSLTG